MKRTMNRSFLVILIFALFYGFSQLLVAANEKSLNEQRKLFLEAEQAIKTNNDARVAQLLPKLKHYSLYPYLLYEQYSKNIAAQNPKDIENFLKTYDSSPLTTKLRQQWFQHLAKAKQWEKIIEHYSEKEHTSALSQCLYAQALINTHQIAKTKDMVQTLWLVDDTQPNECLPVFSAWAKQGYLVDSYVWQRIGLALKAGNMALARTLVTWLPRQEQKTGLLWLKTHGDPFKVTKSEVYDQKHHKTSTIVTHGMTRLAAKHAKAAYEVWHLLARKFALSADQKQEVKEAIALGLIKQDPTTAKALVPKLEGTIKNPKVAHFQLRTHIADNNWFGIQRLIDALPQDKQNDHNWQYWYARSLSQMGNEDDASDIFHRLSILPGYYGILSAVHINKALPLKDEQLPISAAEIKKVNSNPNVIRAVELYAMNRYDAGNAEWLAAVDHMSDKEDYVAAKLAQEWGMNNLAVVTSDRIKHRTDLSLRYPVGYVETVKTNAKRFDIEPAWILAIIRQESRFHPTARSYVGARGLMQLMPGTAKEVARQKNVPVSSNAFDLNDPKTNITLGSAYLKRLLDRFNGHGILATASYNAGPGNVHKWLPQEDTSVDQWIELIPFDETRGYVKNVLVNTAVYHNRLKNHRRFYQDIRIIPAKAKLDQET